MLTNDFVSFEQLGPPGYMKIYYRLKAPYSSKIDILLSKKGVSLTLCCFAVYSTRRFVIYVFPCVTLFLCFLVLLELRLPRLGKRELILVLFVRLFGLCLFRFVGFLFLLGSGKGCGLRLWHSLDFSLTFFTKLINCIKIQS